jgi:murein DD-endopeptidase MepM/ murein hydrolase activator NlpD
MWFPVSLDVDGDRLLLTEWQRRERRLRSRTLEPGAGWVPLAWVPGSAGAVAIAGPYAAVLADGPGGRARLALHDRLTGAEHAALADVSRDGYLDLAPNGQLVAQSDDGLAITSPGGPPRTLAGTGRLTQPRFSGAGLVAVDTARGVNQPVLVAGDGTLGPLSVPTGWVRDLAADERGVAWLANGCVRYAAVAGPPPANAT